MLSLAVSHCFFCRCATRGRVDCVDEVVASISIAEERQTIQDVNETEKFVSLAVLSAPGYLNSMDDAKAYVKGKKENPRKRAQMRAAGIPAYRWASNQKVNTEHLTQGARVELESTMTADDYTKVAAHRADSRNHGFEAPAPGLASKKSRNGAPPPAETAEEKQLREAVEAATKSRQGLKATSEQVSRDLNTVSACEEGLREKRYNTEPQLKYVKAETEAVKQINTKMLEQTKQTN